MQLAPLFWAVHIFGRRHDSEFFCCCAVSSTNPAMAV
jgi:hypothetical protein